MKPWFNVRKAAQIAAFFALKEGGAINVLKLVKLFYLANRNAMERFDFPLVNDNLVSMDHGPVNSLTFDYINGFQDERDEWDGYMTHRAGYVVGLANPGIGLDALDELSVLEIETLEETWAAIGHLTKWEIRDYTHDHCLEWEDPQGSSLAIPYERVFKFLGKKGSDDLAKRVLDQRRIDEVFAGER